jgi:hypothetical protein
MLRAAYPHRDELESAFAEIARAEQGLVEEAVAAAGGDERLAERFAAYRSQAAEQRRRLALDVYFES